MIKHLKKIGKKFMLVDLDKDYDEICKIYDPYHKLREEEEV